MLLVVRGCWEIGACVSFGCQRIGRVQRSVSANRLEDEEGKVDLGRKQNAFTS